MGVAKQKTKKSVHLICGKKRERQGERDERDCRALLHVAPTLPLLCHCVTRPHYLLHKITLNIFTSPKLSKYFSDASCPLS